MRSNQAGQRVLAAAGVSSAAVQELGKAGRKVQGQDNLVGPAALVEETRSVADSQMRSPQLAVHTVGSLHHKAAQSVVLRHRAGRTEAENTAGPGLLSSAVAGSPQAEVGTPLIVVGNHLAVVGSPCSHPEA